MDKETQRKLDLLAALEAGGVENWEGYDLATEEYRKNLAREERAENIVGELFGELWKYIEEPAGRGCGYDFTDEGFYVAIRILLRRAKELCDDHI